jgi:hypothetical protein
MKISKLNLILLVINTVLVIYAVIYKPSQEKEKLRLCWTIALGAEEGRHDLADDYSSSLEDIHSFQKTIFTCYLDD